MTIRFSTAEIAAIIAQDIELQGIDPMDINIAPYQNLGFAITIDRSEIFFDTKEDTLYDMFAKMNDIAEAIIDGETNINGKPISELYGGFFDGGDDIDYSGTYMSVLLDVLHNKLGFPDQES